MTIENTSELCGADGKVLAEEAVKLLVEKLAEDVSMFDVAAHTSITEFYVNVTGRSHSHMAALADELADNFGSRGLSPNRIEGKKGNSWILVDFGALIVNIFDFEGRGFYSFDRLLPVQSKIDINYLIQAVDDKFNITKKD